MITEEHLYAIALRRCSFIGDTTFKKLMDAEGSAEQIWKLPRQKMIAIFGIGDKKAAEIGDSEHLKFAERELEFCQKNNITIHLRHQGDLPFLLPECDDAPAILYQKGKLPEGKHPISIVGTRNMTLYGKQFIHEFLDQIKAQNIITISGLALGVDGEVHSKSIENNIPTVGVLAHGFHTLYPAKHRKLSERILEEGGALLTEFNSSQKPDREHFIQRNRIVAGISPATIVVETAFGGGSISTVGFANDYNREVYAVPGRLTDKYSQGCNLIISQNKAAAIASIKSLVKDLKLKEPKEKIGELFTPSEPYFQLTESQKEIYHIIKENPLISLDEISEKLETPTFKILPILLEMEILGCVKTYSGRQFQVTQ